LPRLAEGLHDLQKGEKRQIVLTAGEAYGFYDPELVIQVSRKKFLKGTPLKVGDQVIGQSKTKSRNDEWKTFRITQISGDAVTLDANHPLAGQDLTFDLEGIEIREATSQEVEDSSIKINSQYFH
jgi:FKBP-type peptidyl-prolyl cis-trans isomerase SlyD